MALLAGPFLAAAVLLGMAGAAKVWRPRPTAAALAALRLPSAPLLARALGVAEIVVAVGALARGTPPFALLVAAAYSGFAVFVGVALAGGVVRSCGCFGQTDTPPTAVHLLLNVAAAIVALGVAGSPALAPARLLTGQPLLAAPFLLLTGACVWLAYLALSELPAVARAAAELRR